MIVLNSKLNFKLGMLRQAFAIIEHGKHGHQAQKRKSSLKEIYMRLNASSNRGLSCRDIDFQIREQEKRHRGKCLVKGFLI